MNAKLIFLAFATVVCQVNGQFSGQFPFGNQGLFRPNFLSNFFNSIFGQQQPQQYPFLGQVWPQQPQPQQIPSLLIPPHFRPTYRPPFYPFYSSEEQGQFQPGTFDIRPPYNTEDSQEYRPSYEVNSEEYHPQNTDGFPEGVQISPPHPEYGQVEDIQQEYYPQNPDGFPEGVQISPPHPEYGQLEVIQPIYISEEEAQTSTENESNEEFYGEDENLPLIDGDEDDVLSEPETGAQVLIEAEEPAPIETVIPVEVVEPQEAVLDGPTLVQAPLA